MGWFGQLCRNMGLMVHNIAHPEAGDSVKKVVRREVEQENKGRVTLRRTTIEEIEVHRSPTDGNDEDGK